MVINDGLLISIDACGASNLDYESRARYSPSLAKKAVMTLKYTHYTTMGATMAPGVADAEGFIVYRVDFQSLPVDIWTPGERWIDARERGIKQAR